CSRVLCEPLTMEACCLGSRLFAWRDAELRRRAVTGEKVTRPAGRSPFPSPIQNADLDRMSIDTDIDLDQDADLGFGGEEESDWDGMTMSLDDLAYEEDLGNAA